GARKGFHLPFAGGRHSLSIRLISAGPPPPDEEEWMWSGELKLDTLGEVAVKLRLRPQWGGYGLGSSNVEMSRIGVEYIARVNVVLLGASVTVTFNRQ
ncbi:unnamed protein product, partial [Choristocarpus tenellus]